MVHINLKMVYLKYHTRKAIIATTTTMATTTPPMTLASLLPPSLAATLPGDAGFLVVGERVIGIVAVLLCGCWVVCAGTLGWALTNLPPSKSLIFDSACSIILLRLSLDTTAVVPSAKIFKTASSTWRFAPNCFGSTGIMTSSCVKFVNFNDRFLLRFSLWKRSKSVGNKFRLDIYIETNLREKISLRWVTKRFIEVIEDNWS